MLQIPQRSKVATASRSCRPGDITGTHRRDASPLQWLSARLLTASSGRGRDPNLFGPCELILSHKSQSWRKASLQQRGPEAERCQVVASGCQPGHSIVQPLHLGSGLTYTSRCSSLVRLFCFVPESDVMGNHFLTSKCHGHGHISEESGYVRLLL